MMMYLYVKFCKICILVGCKTLVENQLLFIRQEVILIIGRRETSKNHKTMVHEAYFRRQKVKKRPS